MNRRSFFGALAAAASAGAFSAIPMDLAIATPKPRCPRCFGPMPCTEKHIPWGTSEHRVPHVYLASSHRVGHFISQEPYEMEIWRHSTDPTWVKYAAFRAEDGPDYEHRHAMMAEIYNRGRYDGRC